MKDIVKIGNVELTKEEAFKLYQDGKYIVTYSKIYQLHYNTAQQRVYGNVIYNEPGGGLTRRGRFHAMIASDVNHLIGYNLVIE